MSDEPVKQNEPVRLATDRDRDEWLMCLQAAAICVGMRMPVAEQADKLYRDLRKRCVK